jgi:hypothetical protein
LERDIRGFDDLSFLEQHWQIFGILSVLALLENAEQKGAIPFQVRLDITNKVLLTVCGLFEGLTFSDKDAELEPVHRDLIKRALIGVAGFGVRYLRGELINKGVRDSPSRASRLSLLLVNAQSGYCGQYA